MTKEQLANVGLVDENGKPFALFVYRDNTSNTFAVVRQPARDGRAQERLSEGFTYKTHALDAADVLRAPYFARP